MTNAMNILIKDPKSEKEKEGTGSTVEIMTNLDTIRVQQPGSKFAKICNNIGIYLVYIFFLQAIIIINYRYNTRDTASIDSLSSSWNRLRVDNRAKLYEAQLYTPEQLHLSLGANYTEIYLTWSTLNPVNVSELVYRKVYDEVTFSKEKVARGKRFDREVIESDSNWVKATRHGSRIIYTYRAKMHGLRPGNLYIYRVLSRVVASGETNTFYSKTYQYLAKNLSESRKSVNLALYGDLGLVNGQSIPRLIQDVDEAKYDVIIHNGDFAYDLNTHNGQYGDDFMRKIEPIAARVPYQTSVGNHEIAENFTHYDHRFTMISSGGVNTGGQNNFYYSFNVGPIHFVAFSTEFYYFLDTVGIVALNNQYEWLKKDLSHASSPSERAERPWIVVFGHRPMYCSSRDGDDCSKDSNILRRGLPFIGSYALEKLFYDYGVDVQLYSHEHQYERFLPIYNGEVFNGTDDLNNPYHNPLAPVHIISGSAGCQERLDPFKGNPATGSVKQISDYGFTRLRASRCELSFQQVSDDQSGSIVDNFVISKTKQNFPVKSEEKFDCKMDSARSRCIHGCKSWLCPGDDLLTPFN